MSHGAGNNTTTAAPVPSADASVLPAGYRIHEYEIEKPLGGGGFGITYLARDANLDLPVAIKEYFPNDLALRGQNHTVLVRGGSSEVQDQYDWGLERFLDEARALATFRHPNIVRVLRYFRDNGTAYIVMEYETGLSLKRWVPQNAPLTQRMLLQIVRPLLEGLEQVHKSGFLHRDIKPDNIYVRADGSPVLLDFGSARRVQTNRELTNIVSPGFAPFEQYHSQGHQGPWTDIYSLGAVMYWMITGKKPVEAAARVKTDSMMPASALVEVSVYGEELLRAIEWALNPDEARRPQTVAEFRQALRAATRHGERDDTTHVVPDQRKMVAAGSGPSHSHSGATSQRRNLLGTIMFLDLVGYSIRSVDDQVAVKKLFNELIAKALRGVAEDSRIAIDTGDGAAICFMGDPEEALHSALLLRDLLTQRYGSVLTARIGLHMGPVRIISDINERTNVIGDGINVAQRVMDFAKPNQVLVSRSYYDVISRITDDTASLFQYLGEFPDKHGRLHEVYAVDAARKGTQSAGGKQEPHAPTQTVPMAPAVALDDAAVHDIEAELARHIGPLSKVLVQKARPLAESIEALREALAPSIQEAAAREHFLSGQGAHHPSTPSGTRSGTSLAARIGLSQPHSNLTQPPRSAPSQPSSRTGLTQPRAGLSQPHPDGGAARGSMTQPPTTRPGALDPRSGPGATQRSMTQSATGLTRATPVSARFDLSAEEQLAVEQALGRFIGPMARIVVKKEAGRTATLHDFVVALGGNIDDTTQREAFMQALKKALPRRSL